MDLPVVDNFVLQNKSKKMLNDKITEFISEYRVDFESFQTELVAIRSRFRTFQTESVAVQRDFRLAAI